MKIVVGSDHLGFELKELLCAELANAGIEPVDIGCHSATDEVDYPDVAAELAEQVGNGRFVRGILFCGTGIGMAIAANKVSGVRAACCHDTYSAERARRSNNAQVLCLGSLVVGPALAREVLRRWLDAEFDGGRSARKVAKIDGLDASYRPRNKTQ